METIEPISPSAEVKQLLASCDLNVADISPSGSILFFGCRSGPELAGIIGLEVFGPVALLRSLAVAPPYRDARLGRKLVAFAEARAVSLGVQSLFLLTTTAEQFFSKIGYSAAAREEAPAAIMNTTQFSSLCPASSSFMNKRLCSQDGAPKEQTLK